MSDNKIEISDMSVELSQETTNSVMSIAQEILGPVTNFAGLIEDFISLIRQPIKHRIQDSEFSHIVKMRQAYNIVEVLSIAKNIRDSRGLSPRRLSLKEITPVVEGMANEENPDIQKMWAHLILEGGAKSEGSRVIYADILRSITPSVARMLIRMREFREEIKELWEKQKSDYNVSNRIPIAVGGGREFDYLDLERNISIVMNAWKYDVRCVDGEVVDEKHPDINSFLWIVGVATGGFLIDGHVRDFPTFRGGDRNIDLFHSDVSSYDFDLLRKHSLIDVYERTLQIKREDHGFDAVFYFRWARLTRLADGFFSVVSG